MKRSLKRLSGYTLETIDGKNGKVNDFLFDEKQWIIRYLEADFGNLFSSQKILIPRAFLRSPIWENSTFPTELKEDQIKNCPKIDEHLPVSRKYENELFKYYQINPYWATPYGGLPGNFYTPRLMDVPSEDFSEKGLDTILRSFNEVDGYFIHAIDGRLGHIEDLLIDDTDWKITYVIIDTKNWLPWSKKVIIAVDWMDSISYEKKEVKINLKTDTIKDAPEFHSIELLDFRFEQSLYDFYSQSLIK